MTDMATEQVEATFAGRLASVGASRAFVEATLAVWDCDDPDEIAVLLTSELVTNAVIHVGQEFRVGLVLRDLELEVAVADSSTDLPQLRQPAPVSEGGRGLWLVALLAKTWGARRTTEGKAVWFRVPVRRRTVC